MQTESVVTNVINEQSELPRSIPWNFRRIILGCTSRIYFDNVTLRLHNRNHANTITSVIAAKQTGRNKVNVVVVFFNKYRFSNILLKTLNFLTLFIADKRFG